MIEPALIQTSSYATGLNVCISFYLKNVVKQIIQLNGNNNVYHAKRRHKKLHYQGSTSAIIRTLPYIFKHRITHDLYNIAEIYYRPYIHALVVFS